MYVEKTTWPRGKLYKLRNIMGEKTWADSEIKMHMYHRVILYELISIC